ncbi:MAG: nucleotidyltransferase domain-containing protein [Saprospiraceae bacterium]|nr:nucleotidyltransferase domain-containing protein [Saprospiraceae bacterium]
MNPTILDLLAQIEHDKGIQIRYACESGSRAWGFPSPDSDFDIRFIYLHPREWYLSVNEGEDNVRVMPNDLLDGNGWDFRKFLRLMHASNSTVYEWLSSPIVYIENKPFSDALWELALGYFQPKKVIFHYIGIATGMLEKEFQAPSVKIKKYFYVLRPVLSAVWIAEKGTPPPIDFYELLPLVQGNAPVHQAILDLLKQKETALEGQQVQRVQVLDDFVAAEMQHCEVIAKQMEKRPVTWDAINDFYRKTLDIK